jgi:amidase
MSDELAFLDATGLAERIRDKELSPREAVDAAIARIEKLDPRLNAVIHPLFDKARAAADADALPDGPFRGVPFLLKDLDGYSAGDPWHGGMRFLKELRYVALHDSYQFAKFREAGLVVVGKTNTPELGLTITTEPEAYGPSRNPWNPEHSTGGSSGGSAAAVASGMVPAAHAGDGGGSIRIPASECGLVGLKPSRGRVSLGPDYGEQWHGFVCEHVVARSVRDSARLLDVTAGPMPGDPYVAPLPVRPFADEAERDPGRLRVGLCARRPDADALHADCAEAVHAAGRALESLGHEVELALPPALEEVDDFRAHFTPIVGSWTRATLDLLGIQAGRTIEPQEVESGTWALAEVGRRIGAPEYIASALWIEGFTRRMAGWWTDGFDLLVTPTLGEPPPPLGYLKDDPDDPSRSLRRLFALMAFTPQWNATGQPAISLPLHWNAGGLPIGVQIVAAYAREDLLFRVAGQLERAVPWSQHRPPIHA